MRARNQDLTTSIGLLVLRVGVGGYLATHGWGKFQMVLDGQFDQFGDPIGLGSGASLVLVMIAEFFCALLVVIGLGTRYAAIPPVIAMAVAAFVAHGGDPWTMSRAYELFASGQAESAASKQPALMFLIGFLALCFTGAGRYSLDALIGGRRKAGSSAR